ncbi:MAG: alpha/beta hydrolase [Firmicutes bacterium]|nr:alpha/beta hydrolase [Bacillota bacterium]
MAKNKYPISSEFFPFDRFTPPITKQMIALAQKNMTTPKFIYKDPDVEVTTRSIPGYKEGELELIIFTPKGFQAPGPCFINIHGGGFVFEGFTSHFHHALTYAKDAGCVVVYVKYRLAPKYPFPYPQEDSYAALLWVYDNADELGIDRGRIGIGGDSAGGTLTVTSCMMARDRSAQVKPLFQLLIYPWLDDRNISESYLKYDDTPMWNSSMSRSVGPMTNPDPSATPLAYRSPVEADSFEGLPPAYIEVAEFDPLHDDGIYYASLLEREGISVELHETKGTMHGFDTKVKAPTTQRMLKLRTEFMKKMFEINAN